MGSTPVAYIDADGCHVPAFATELAYFQGVFRGVFGDDVNLDPALQDGQFVGLIATALHDVNSGILAAYNSFSPGGAVGVGLSRLVKINGLARATASFSTAELTLVGQAGAVIAAGSLVADESGQTWAVPGAVIPDVGQVNVTATCTAPGAVTAPAGSIASIQTVTRGWQKAFNTDAATPGAPVELDGALRRRQTLSTAVPARTTVEASKGAILALPGVTAVDALENDTDVTDSRVMPPHSVAYVVTGGDDQAIGDMIRRKKGIASTYGNTVVTSYDAAGIPHRVAFYRATQVPVSVYLTVTALQGFTQDTQTAIAQAVAAWINGQPRGSELVRSRAIAAAILDGTAAGRTFKLKDLQFARNGQGPSPGDLEFAFYEQPVADPANVSFYFPAPGVV